MGDQRKLAFVLGGGGAHGATQVGALRALLEANIRPDMLIGTSIGAINAGFLALKGVSLEGVERLARVWMEAKDVVNSLMPPNYVWLSLLAMLGRHEITSSKGFRDFLLTKVELPDIRFEDIQGVELYMVAADLATGKPVIFGANRKELLIDGIEASTALPPWRQPIKTDGYYLVDGGFVSNLPVEPALALGATHIVAFDLTDPLGTQFGRDGTKVFLSNAIQSVVLRQRELEMALAAARGVPLMDIVLGGFSDVPLWDFSHTRAMIDSGYATARKALEDEQNQPLLAQLTGRKWSWDFIRRLTGR